MSEIRRPRRYYLLKRLALANRGELALSDVFAAKQEAEQGVSLPELFPLRAKLVGAGYSTFEDIDGADLKEMLVIGLSNEQAKVVLTAAAAAKV